MLRHWFATDMIQRGINPEIARRQLRHKNIETTMKIYVQVNNSDLLSSVPQRPEILRLNSDKNARITPHLKLIS
jgi:integrase